MVMGIMSWLQPKARGTMFFGLDILDTYNLTKRYAGLNGRVASMPDVIKAKLAADSKDPVWTRYISTISGEFYGRSAGRNPIVVVSHDISHILENNVIMERPMKNPNGKTTQIQLTSREFRELESGKHGPVEVLDVATINAMRQYASSAVSYDEACNDQLLIARLGPEAKPFLTKQKDITMAESGNDCVVINDHRYEFIDKMPRSENTGGLIHIDKLMNVNHWHGRSTHWSVLSQTDVSSSSSAARFIAVEGSTAIGKVRGGLEDLFGNMTANWKDLMVSNNQFETSDLYTLHKLGPDLFFTEYEKPQGHTMRSGKPKMYVASMTNVPSPTTFTTKIQGYYGFFRYDIDDVEAIKPSGANAYLMGEPYIVPSNNGDPTEHAVPIEFFNVRVDTSRRLLTESEVKSKFALVKKLLG